MPVFLFLAFVCVSIKYRVGSWATLPGLGTASFLLGNRRLLAGSGTDPGGLIILNLILALNILSFWLIGFLVWFVVGPKGPPGGPRKSPKPRRLAVGPCRMALGGASRGPRTSRALGQQKAKPIVVAGPY